MSSSRPIGADAAISFAKRIGVVLVLLAIGIFVSTSCVARVDAGHVGIRVKLAGSSRGVDDIPVVTGWVFYNPLTEQLVMFPISVQNVVWTKDVREGSAHDESITFSSREGVNINADVGLSFHVESSRAPHLYLKFRKPNVLDVADGYVRNAVREAFNMVASQQPVQDIYGAGKGNVVAEVTKKLRDQLAPDGFMIDQLTINGALRLPENVAQAINRAMEATQQAIQAENRVRQVKAEAEQAITQAEGQASAARAKARGDADARLTTAKAEAKANLILRLSTSGSVLQYRALEKWNGKLPLMNGGGSLPMLTFDASKMAKAGDDDEKRLRELLGDDDEKAPTPAKDDGDKPKGDQPKVDDAKPAPAKPTK